jgi:hypothetical protein
MGRTASTNPGDTKLAKKWRMDGTMMKGESEWEWPLRQIQHYCTRLGTRYGFLITEEELVVFRFSREKTGKGLGGDRSKRQTTGPKGAVHARGDFVSSGLSEEMSMLSMVSENDTSVYNDDEPDTDVATPEYCSIPWSQRGNGRMTVRLALFFLCMLAGEAGGPAFVETRQRFIHPQHNGCPRRNEAHVRHG